MTSSTSSTGAVLLAGGSGSRFQASHTPGSVPHKLMADFRGRPLIEWSIDTAVESNIGPVAVVSGAVSIGRVAAALGEAIVEVANPNWAAGQASSLAAAVGWAEREELDAIVVGLADQPLVPASAWRAVAAATGAIVTATFVGRRRPPVKLDKSVWKMLPTEGDEGARALFRSRPDLISEVPCCGNPVDIDTMEDLQKWN